MREHRAGKWVAADWTHKAMIGQPFAEFTWRQAQTIVAQRRGDPGDQQQIAAALADLLARAGAGSSQDRRVIARQHAAPSVIPTPRPTLDPAPQRDPTDPIIPFGVFDPDEEL